jgi:hypothetical protein
MKNRKTIFVVLLFFLVLILVCCTNANYIYSDGQSKWATENGVKQEDYPYPSVFPVYYFDSILAPGDSLEKVHNIIKGYEKVYHCSYSELYYFFSSDSSKALRFMVLYDKDKKYSRLTLEDKNSTNLDTMGCVADGLLLN